MIAAFLVLSAWSSLVAAVGMAEPYRQELSLVFENKDRLQISCNPWKDGCHLRMTVNGKRFSYGAEELGAEPTPESARLYSGSGSGRQAYFSFDVSVRCPEQEDDGLSYDCYVNGLVNDGKLEGVDVHRRREEVVLPPKR